MTHGDLGYVRFPVAVGHYVGDTIAGAEAHLDGRLGGALSHRYRLGLYPGAAGTVELVTRAHGTDGLTGALVIGLGEMGRLSAQLLAEGVRLGALEYALREAERNGDTPPGLTFLLIGCGLAGPGLAVEESVEAILRGVVLANRELGRLLGDSTRIPQVEFVELYEAAAIQACHALTRLVPRFKQSLRVEIEAAPLLRPGRGGRPGTATRAAGGYWRRILVEGKQDGLKFTYLSDRARTEVTGVPTQRRLVDRLVRDSVGSREWQPEQAKTLFELLVPNDFKDRLAAGGDLVLVVDPGSANYPWELLNDGRGEDTKPIAVRIGAVRQLQTAEYRRQIRAATGRDALVVGDPDLGGLPLALPQLPGAAREAEAVAGRLAVGGFTVHSCLGTRALPIVNELFARPYRILHLAGHGVYRQDLGPAGEPAVRTGMVLGEEVLLTAAEFGQLAVIPDLVFFNCCHLGVVDAPAPSTTEFNKLAASVAQELIRLGVRAVVAAGWAVEDRAAEVFAVAFYDHLLGGETFGRAVLRARQAAHEASPHGNTWGAYQAYGDPDFTLRREGKPPPPAEGEAARVSPREAVEAFGDLASEARGGLDVPALRASLAGRLEDLFEALPGPWRLRADVQAAAGEAWGELGDFARAVGCYERALAAEDGGLPLRTVVQLANLEVRWAATLPAGAARDRIDRAIGRVESLLTLAETGERRALLASAWKGRARVAEDAGALQEALEASAENYRRAGEHLVRVGDGGFYYPVLNGLACEVLLGRAAPDLGDWLDRCAEAAAQALLAQPTFWAQVIPATVALVRHLEAGDLPEHQEEVLAAYRTALARGAPPRELSSVLEDLEFLAGTAETLGRRSGVRVAGVRALRELGAALKG